MSSEGIYEGSSLRGQRQSLADAFEDAFNAIPQDVKDAQSERDSGFVVDYIKVLGNNPITEYRVGLKPGGG